MGGFEFIGSGGVEEGRVSIGNKSPELKAERGYKDKRSFVRPTGEEILYGKDWDARKLELQRRSAGRCERFTIMGKSHDAWCRGEGGEPHHIKPRRAGRDDRLVNLANLNHWCHAGEDPRVPRFGEGLGESAERSSESS